MENCHKDFKAYYRDEVALSEPQKSEMRQRRNSNRKSLKQGLARDDEPKSLGSQSQGSYAMHTMVQHTDNDYDIDDGVYFTKASLVGPNGGDKTPAAAKEMVRKALHSAVFTTPVACLKNCVRVQYNAGYHVDVPVYRKVEKDDSGNAITPYYELASSSWKKSDPLAVTQWFQSACSDKSEDTSDGTQVRRLVRYLKKFARSRESWSSSIASGFIISKLTVDNYRGSATRDDKALRNTMRAIHDALDFNATVYHPIYSSEPITASDASAKFLKDKLSWALDQLEGLDGPDCDRNDALKIWDKVFKTTFFSDRADKSVSAASILRSADEHPDRAVGLGGTRRFG